MSAVGVSPRSGISQEKAAQFVCAHDCRNTREERILRAIYRKTKIDYRHSVLSESRRSGSISLGEFFGAEGGRGPSTQERMLYFEKKAPALARRATLAALRKAHLPAHLVGHIVSVSCTGAVSPGFDVPLIQSIGISKEASRTHVGFMGCHGVFNALRVASALAKTDARGQAALICSVELCSLHYELGGQWDLRRALTNALFSDGAAAAIVSSTPAYPECWRIQKTGSQVFKNSTTDMTWRVGNHGFAMYLSSKIPQLIRKNLKPWLSRWLASEGLSIQAIQSWALHPGGPGILDAIKESLSLPEEALAPSRTILRKFGNMSSATILFVLEELFRLKKKSPCVALGFGPGLTVEAVLFL